ncbi:EXS family-domain-containing protein, partial [Radiomyces spectabilis]|uniref:EXS family-domain-containing protein n=1 Tax=Radiomyces spectabilis TaxID=64574 RepID=UPI0022210ABD
GRIVLSYCYPVEFRDFFIADELNSLSYSFWTLGYFFCAYWRHWTDLGITMLITPFVASLPPWWRLLQCIRRYQDSRQKVHLVNGVKYTTSILATMITGFRRSYPSGIMDVAWVLSSILNSSYTSIWDIKMDWGLLQPNSQHFLLRDELVFASWTYYAAIPINIMLRFAWTINAAGLRLDGQLLAFISAALEAGRRLQWNFFRLENE